MAQHTTCLTHSKVGQIAIPVHDLGRAVSFYRDTLGLPFLFEVPKLAFFDAAGIRLMMSVPESAEFDHASSILYFAVDDIQTAYAELESRGVKFRGEPHCIARMSDREVWMAFFDDTEGNTHAIMSELLVA